MVKILKYLFVVFVVFSCSPKFHGDARLLGGWKSLSVGIPDIYFDSTYYYFNDLDTAKRTAYALNYKVSKELITTYAKNTVFTVIRILRVEADTIVLQNTKSEIITYFVRKRK